MKCLVLLIVFCGLAFEGAVLAQSSDLDEAWEDYKVSDKFQIILPIKYIDVLYISRNFCYNH
jgi:hypothetical protein